MRDILSIGEAARASGVKIPTIRYYEEIGLLPPPRRTEKNRRLYSQADLHRLGFIRHARELGFDIEAIRTLVALEDEPNQPCAVADKIAQDRLAEVEQKIRSLTALRHELELMVEGCRHGRVAQCRVVEVLADYGRHPNHGFASTVDPATKPSHHGTSLPDPDR